MKDCTGVPSFHPSSRSGTHYGFKDLSGQLAIGAAPPQPFGLEWLCSRRRPAVRVARPTTRVEEEGVAASAPVRSASLPFETSAVCRRPDRPLGQRFAASVQGLEDGPAVPAFAEVNIGGDGLLRAGFAEGRGSPLVIFVECELGDPSNPVAGAVIGDPEVPMGLHRCSYGGLAGSEAVAVLASASVARSGP